MHSIARLTADTGSAEPYISRSSSTERSVILNLTTRHQGGILPHAYKGTDSAQHEPTDISICCAAAMSQCLQCAVCFQICSGLGTWTVEFTWNTLAQILECTSKAFSLKLRPQPSHCLKSPAGGLSGGAFPASPGVSPAKLLLLLGPLVSALPLGGLAC